MKSRISEGKKNADMADNQVAFRKLNSKLEKLISELEEMAGQRGVSVEPFKGNMRYHFYCECSDENCTERILLSFDEYEKLHERDDTFTIKPSHEVFDIEEVISKTPEYYVVKKFETPKQTNETFHETALNNVG